MFRALLLLPFFVLSSCGYNSIQGLEEDVNAAWSEVQNQYKRRADLVPQLISVVKGVKDYEKETLEAVINARAKATQITLDSKDLESPEKFAAFQKAQGELGSTLSRLLVSVERYPELKATENFKDLQAQLEGTENRIAVARKRYIDTVAAYNKKVRYFPTNLTAKFLLGAEPKQQFAVDASENVEKVPEINFD